MALTIAASVLLAGCATLPPWKSVPTGPSVVYGQIEDSRRAIGFLAFADDPGIIAVTVENRYGGFSPRYGMVVDQPARTAMREALAKYAEWSKLAEQNNVELTRDIKSVSLPQMFPRHDGWEAEGTREVTFVFNSHLVDGEPPRTTLLMRTDAPFYSVDRIVLSDEQAADFARYLQDEQITAAYQQAKKKQQALELFK